MKAEIGIIGLGVMGKSLSRNLARNGFKLSMYNRHVEGIEEAIALNFQRQYPELKQSFPYDNLKTFVSSLSSPRKIILMVSAGAAVDSVMEELSTYLDAGDVIIDGGNSHFKDTDRRIARLKNKNLFFIGAGISGGEAGALNGPSIMPSGEKEAYAIVQKYLEAIAAKDKDGNPCCAYLGNQGSGHFVKMVHNGIEYVEMQLLAECYAILKNQQLSNDEIALIFESWKADLNSYFLEISIQILRKREENDYLLDKILDKAGNKGTGKWTTTSITDLGEPATMIPAALLARYLSFFKEKRESIAKIFPTVKKEMDISLLQLKAAYQYSRIINHHQGFAIISQASKQHNWKLNLSEIARIWTAGCIIKSNFMIDLVEYLKSNSDFFLNEKLSPIIRKTYPAIKILAVHCIKNEIHIPCFLEALNFFHGIKTANSSASLIQAQRDYFGAHTYQRKDEPIGNNYHTEWEI